MTLERNLEVYKIHLEDFELSYEWDMFEMFHCRKYLQNNLHKLNESQLKEVYELDKKAIEIFENLKEPKNYLEEMGLVAFTDSITISKKFTNEHKELV